MKKYILHLLLLIAFLYSCNKEKNKPATPVPPTKPSTVEYSIFDSAYGTNDWAATEKPLPANYEHFPYNKSENIYFDTGGIRKFCVIRLDTFDRYFATKEIQSFRVLGYSKSFYTYDSNYNGTPSVRISFEGDKFSLYSGVEMPDKTKSFVLTGTKKQGN